VNKRWPPSALVVSRRLWPVIEVLRGIEVDLGTAAGLGIAAVVAIAIAAVVLIQVLARVLDQSTRGKRYNKP
jgi:hypothetical protein